MAERVESFNFLFADLADEIFHEIGDEGVEETLECLSADEARDCVGELREDCVMQRAEERDGRADGVELEVAGVEAVVEVGGEVGDFVGEVDELGFEWWELREKIFGELGVG